MADIKVRSPLPAYDDPTNNPLMTLVDQGDGTWALKVSSNGASGTAGGAPTTVDYLVGTASADLSNEIVVGTTPGGELSGTWGSPTVDATHSGSSHASIQTAAESTASVALAAHTAAADPHTGYALTTQGGLVKVNAIGVAGATATIDPSLGNIHTVTVTTATTIVLTAPTSTRAAATPGSILEIRVTQDSAGGRTLTWPGTVTWINGTPSPSTVANSVSMYVLETIDAGATWRGILVGGSTGLSGQVVVSDGTNPTYAYPPGYQIDYAEVTTNVTISGTAVSAANVVVTGASVLFDGSRVAVEFYARAIVLATSTTLSLPDGCNLNLFEDGVDIGYLGGTKIPGTTPQADCYAKTYLTPTAGYHTYSVKGWVNAAGSATVAGGPGGALQSRPIYLAITKA